MPLLTIPLDAIADQLLLRKHAADDYGVQVEAGEFGRLTVGRIMRVARSSGRVAFMWTITGPAVPDAGIGLIGEEEALEDAKIAFRAAFDRVLYWASTVKDGNLPWHVGADRVALPEDGGPGL